MPVSILEKLDHLASEMQCHKSALARTLLIKGLNDLSISDEKGKSFDF
jgi:hypothetical protein